MKPSILEEWNCYPGHFSLSRAYKNGRIHTRGGLSIA